ncbi:MAG: hypothetical protein AAFZ15_14655 [Bacteroidota bacterium]
MQFNFHAQSGIYEIEMKVKWNAKGCALCRRKDHQINGILIVDKEENIF